MMIHFVVKEVAPPVRASKTHLMLVAFTTERFTGVGKSVKDGSAFGLLLVPPAGALLASDDFSSNKNYN